MVSALHDLSVCYLTDSTRTLSSVYLWFLQWTNYYRGDLVSVNITTSHGCRSHDRQCVRGCTTSQTRRRLRWWKVAKSPHLMDALPMIDIVFGMPMEGLPMDGTIPMEGFPMDGSKPMEGFPMDGDMLMDAFPMKVNLMTFHDWTRPQENLFGPTPTGCSRM